MLALLVPGVGMGGGGPTTIPEVGCIWHAPFCDKTFDEEGRGKTWTEEARAKTWTEDPCCAC